MCSTLRNVVLRLPGTLGPMVDPPIHHPPEVPPLESKYRRGLVGGKKDPIYKFVPLITGCACVMWCDSAE